MELCALPSTHFVDSVLDISNATNHNMGEMHRRQNSEDCIYVQRELKQSVEKSNGWIFNDFCIGWFVNRIFDQQDSEVGYSPLSCLFGA